MEVISTTLWQVERCPGQSTDHRLSSSGRSIFLPSLERIIRRKTRKREGVESKQLIVNLFSFPSSDYFSHFLLSSSPLITPLPHLSLLLLLLLPLPLLPATLESTLARREACPD